MGARDCTDMCRSLPKEHPESYWSFMHKNLFDHVNIRPEAIHLPDGTNPDAADACAKYNEIIHSVGGIDLQLLGLGPNGHVGFNEPCEEFIAETHKVRLTETTIRANSRFFASENDVPRYAYTMGIRGILQAKRLVLVVNGAKKAQAVKDAFFGPITPPWASRTSIMALAVELWPSPVLQDKNSIRIACSTFLNRYFSYYNR